MKEYKIEVNGTFMAIGEFKSPEIAWKVLSEISTQKYSDLYKMDLEYIRGNRYLLLSEYGKKSFNLSNGDIIIGEYTYPVFAGYYNDKLTNNNLIDEIRSIHIKQES